MGVLGLTAVSPGNGELMMENSEANHKAEPGTLPYIDARNRLRALVDYEDGCQTIFALVAEPGMGRTSVIEGIIDHAKSEGYKTHLVSLEGWSSEDAATKIVRLARDAAHGRTSSHVMVAIDDIPPADETVVRREARAIRRMAASGCIVVLSMVPEAEQLLEPIGAYCRIATRDLLFVERADAGLRAAPFPVIELTHGIPALVSAFRPGRGDSLVGSDGVPTSYYDALVRLVRGSLRPTLMSEEIDARLAMLLLGRGSLDDLMRVLGRGALEIIEDLDGRAPLFGVSISERGFSCAGMSGPYALSACNEPLEAFCRERPRVAINAADVLASRGAFARAATVCVMAHDPGALAVARRWGTEMLDAGQANLVAEVLASEGERGDQQSARRDMLVSALSAVQDRHANLPMSSEGLGEDGFDREPSNSLLMCMARMALQGTRPTLTDELLASASLDDLGFHLKVFGLMCDGRADIAFRMLVTHAAPQEEQTLSSALLALDYEAARLLMCEAPAPESESIATSIEMVNAREVGGFRGLARSVYAMELAMRGAPSMADLVEVERLAVATESSGEALLQVVALLAGATLDLRTGYATRAHVRASLAESVAEGLDYAYVRQIAHVISCVARFELGEPVLSKELDEIVDPRENLDLAVVAAVLACAMTGDAKDDVRCGAFITDRGYVPRGALWILVMLTNGVGRLSKLLEAAMPVQWRRAVSVAHGNVEEETPPESTDEGEGVQPVIPDRGVQAPDSSVMVSLLGGFSVCVGGQEMSEGRLDYRKAKSMLEFLLLCRRHSAQRFQIVEQLWPGTDYRAGLDRVYQATATVRAAFSEMSSKKVDPFITSKAAKSMTVNSAVVRCDVDDFRNTARSALASNDEERVVELARRADELYTGPLYIPPADSSGYVIACRSELCRLHADAMVAGAEAAYRLGRNHAAARFSEVALASDGLREDAIIVLVRALRASGRAIEAERRYKAYARQLVEKTDRPPSRMLRIAAGEDCGSEGTSEERRTEDADIDDRE